MSLSADIQSNQGMAADLTTRRLAAKGIEDIAPEVWDVHIAGRRVVILRAETDNWTTGKHGSPIIIPDTAKDPIAGGHVISVGPQFGDPGLPFDRLGFHDFLINPQSDILGRYVIFGDWVGRDLKLQSTDARFQTDFLIMQEWEIWGIVTESEKGNDAVSSNQ